MITFSKVIRAKGSNQPKVNVSLNGKPYGQIWTFKEPHASGIHHPWHFKTLSGFYRTFDNLEAAKAFATHLTAS